MKHFVLLSSIPLLVACNAVNHEHEEMAIRELLKQEQRAHLEKDTELFVSEFAPDMIGINKGKASVLTTEEHLERFGQYFSNVDFIAWEDTAEPLIRFSDDATLAYAILQKQVILTQKDDVTSKPDTTNFAWISVLRKMDGQWKIECNVSTNQPK
jgi:hypothetical protein